MHRFSPYKNTRSRTEGYRQNAAGFAELPGTPPSPPMSQEAGPSSSAAPPPDEDMETNARNSQGSGGGAGGTMVSGGFRAATTIPPELSVIGGPWMHQRYIRLKIPISQSWGGWRRATDALDPPAVRTAAIMFDSPYHVVPDMLLGMYLDNAIGSWLNDMQYWKVEHAGWKIVKCDIHRYDEITPNANSPQGRIGTSWQPQFIVGKGQHFPQHFLPYDGTKLEFTKGNEYNTFDDLNKIFDYGSCDGEVVPPKVMFNMVTRFNPTSSPIANLPIPKDPYGSTGAWEDDGMAWSKTVDPLFRHTTKYEMNQAGPVFEKKCFKGWRFGRRVQDQIQYGNSYTSNNVDTQMSDPNRLAPDLSVYANQTHQDKAMWNTRRSHEWASQLLSVRNQTLGPIGIMKDWQYRNDTGGFLPHPGKETDTHTFIRFERPPNLSENDQSQWFAILDIETECVGQFENSNTLVNENFVSGIAGDQRTNVFVNNHTGGGNWFRPFSFGDDGQLFFTL